MKKSRQARAPATKTARFGVYLDPETRKALLHAAIDDGLSATQLVERLIKDYLARRKGSAGSR